MTRIFFEKLNLDFIPIIDFSNYELIDLNKEHEYSNLAEMDNDCKVTFNENGFLINRISFGRRFGSKSVATDTLFYSKNNQLNIIRNNCFMIK